MKLPRGTQAANGARREAVAVADNRQRQKIHRESTSPLGQSSRADARTDARADAQSDHQNLWAVTDTGRDYLEEQKQPTVSRPLSRESVTGTARVISEPKETGKKDEKKERPKERPKVGAVPPEFTKEEKTKNHS